MRMDNETYRIKVENLFRALYDENGDIDREKLSQLEGLAVIPKKTRYFLKVLAGENAEIQTRFLRHVMAHNCSDNACRDLERHIRHRFYEDRDQAKVVLADIDSEKALTALFRVINLTEEGWLAGELIRLVLSYPPEKLAQPINQALQSKDYLLQCLGIYLIGKSKDPNLVALLAKFYEKPIGEKLDRLENKAYDALMEAGPTIPDELVIDWLRHKRSRIRLLGLAVARLTYSSALLGDIVRLVLVDTKTRTQAAAALLDYDNAAQVTFATDDDRAQGIAEILTKAKQAPLVVTLQNLMRDENAEVREVAVKLSNLLVEPGKMAGDVRRLALEDPATTVQVASLRTLAGLDRSKLLPTLVDVLSGATRHAEVLEAGKDLVSHDLDPSERRIVETAMAEKEQKREAALDRFSGDVEWWRHDM